MPHAEAEPILDVGKMRTATEAAYTRFAIDQAAGIAMGALNSTNKYVTDSEPWHLPDGDPRRLVIVRTRPTQDAHAHAVHLALGGLLIPMHRVWHRR